MHEKEETEPYRAAPIGPKTYAHMPFRSTGAGS